MWRGPRLAGEGILMQLPSWDVFIGLAFLFGIAYGFILQREKIIATLCSVYVGMVIASTFSQTIFDFFNGNKVIANQIWIKSNASVSTIAIVLFFITIIAVAGALNSRSGGKNGEISMIEIFMYSSMMIALVIASVLGFMPEAVQAHAIQVSKAAAIIFQIKTFLIVSPPIILVIFGWRKKSK